MKDRLLLAAYLGAVLVATLRHELWLLAAMLLAALLLAGADAWRIARKVLLAILVFNGVVTLTYVLVSLWQETFSAHFVALLNLRVFLLTFLTLLLARRINAYRAFSFSTTLSYLLALAASQTVTLRRLAGEFRLALASRTLTRLRRRDAYRHAGTLGARLLHKSVAGAVESAQAMRSRGFFRD